MNQKPTTKTGSQPVVPQSMYIVDRIEDRSGYVDVRTLSPYDFIDHAYHGSHGFRDCSYLAYHVRETMWQTRRRHSYYVNTIKPVINCMVDPVFSTVAKREYDDEMFLKFVDNGDNCGTPLQNIVKSAILDARRKDVSFVLMDNFTEAEIQQAQNQPEAVRGRILPFIQRKRVQDVYEHTVDRFGKLDTIAFFDECIKSSDGKTDIQTYKEWTATGWRKFYVQNTKDNQKIQVTIEEGKHSVGYLPVYAILDFAENKNLTELPFPSLYDLTYLCYAMFNKESEVVTLEGNQCFSILCVSGVDAATMSAIGPQNFLSVSNDAKTQPGYISPSGEHLINLTANCDRLEEKIYKYAQQKGVIAVKTEQSGTAKGWDFRAEEEVLRATAQAAENLEYWCAQTFMAYTKRSFTYKIVYPTNYNPTYKQDRIDGGLKILDMNPPAPLAEREWKEIAILRHGTDEETDDTLIEEMDADTEWRREREKEMRERAAAGEGGEVTGEGGEGEGEGEENGETK